MSKKWLAGAGVAAIVAIVTAIYALRRDDSAAPTTPAQDPLISEFREVERTSLAAYNSALREQRENRIDELELSNVIETDVLVPWRALRARVNAAAVPPGGAALYASMRKYLELRQISWEAYVAALRAPSDEAARSHIELHRQKNAEAQDEARSLADQLRSLHL